MRDDDLHLDDFQPAMAPASVSATAAEARAGRRRRQREQFIRVPMTWALRLSGARYTATLKVALHLLDRAFRTHASTIRLANTAFEGLTPKQKWRALDELEDLGLVAIERRPRKSPLVTLLYPEGGE